MVAPSSSLLFLVLCSSLCVSVVCVAVILKSYTPNLPLYLYFPHELVSSLLGVVIQGKTSPIPSGVLSHMSSLLLLQPLCNCLCVSVVCVAVILKSYTPNLPVSLYFPLEHVCSSLGVVIQGKTPPILSGMVSLSSSLHFLSSCSSLSVSDTCVAINLRSYPPNLPLSVYFPH